MENKVPAVTMRDITKSFSGTQALKGVDLEVYPGEMVYHNVDEDSFFTMPEEDFFELFDEAKD